MSAERKAVSYYRACMDVNKTMDRLDSKPLTDLLSELFGSSWVPSAHPGGVTDFNVSAWNFQRTLELTQALGLDTFFNVWVSEDDKQPTHNILQVVTVVRHSHSCRSVHILHFKVFFRILVIYADFRLTFRFSLRLYPVRLLYLSHNIFFSVFVKCEVLAK